MSEKKASGDKAGAMLCRFTEKQMEEIGCRICDLRKSKKISQAKLAELLEVSDNTMSALENGKSELTGSKLHFLSSYFEVSYEYILEGREARTISDELSRLISQMSEDEQACCLAALQAWQEKQAQLREDMVRPGATPNNLGESAENTKSVRWASAKRPSILITVRRDAAGEDRYSAVSHKSKGGT